jgi:hypothetical protein
MNPIKFECPHCHEIIAGDESLFGQRVKCRKCQAAILVPQAPVSTGPQTARLIQEPAATAPVALDKANQEADIFTLSPVARAFPAQIILEVIFIGLGIVLAIRAQDSSWPRWVAAH